MTRESFGLGHGKLVIPTKSPALPANDASKKVEKVEVEVEEKPKKSSRRKKSSTVEEEKEND
jgi:hypothetical protein